LPQILFQVYFPLGQLAIEKSFTHYDLHYKNVLIYVLPEDKYVKFEYTTRDKKKVSFQSRYVAKIIDYGRSYYKDIKTSSLKTRKKLCKTKKCKPECGTTYGFAQLNGAFVDPFLNSTKFNPTYDLRLLHKFSNVKSIKRLGYLSYKPEDPKAKTSGYPVSINNVIDASDSLKDYIDKRPRSIQGGTSSGTIIVDTVEPLEYIPN
jgi:hypothetical protein